MLHIPTPLTVNDIIWQRVAVTPQLPVFSVPGSGGWRPISWKRFGHDVWTAGQGLMERGIGPGERVALLARPRYEWEVADKALMSIGAVSVGLDARTPTAELERIFQAASIQAAVVVDAGILARLPDAFLARARLVVLMEPAEQARVPCPLATVKELMSGPERSAPPRVRVAPSDPAVVVYTSGTTGTPKGIPFNHSQLVVGVPVMARVFRGPSKNNLTITLCRITVRPMKKTAAKIRHQFEQLRDSLDERGRREWAASEAMALGHGGIATVHRATGIVPSTIGGGIQELEGRRERAVGPQGQRRVRKPGGGRRKKEKEDPTVLEQLERLIEPETRGDPEPPLRWTCKSLSQLSKELAKKGYDIGRDTVARLLKKLGYSLRANSKTAEGKQHPDRNAQFEYINEITKQQLAAGDPAISVEYVFEGNCARRGGYREDDSVSAIHVYTRTKIAGEMIAAVNPDHLVIRTSFDGRESVKYKGAFSDQYTTRDFVDVIAPHYLLAAKSGLRGVIHIGTSRKTQYNLLRQAFPRIRPIKIADVDSTLADDTSLDCSKWKDFVGTGGSQAGGDLDRSLYEEVSECPRC